MEILIKLDPAVASTATASSPAPEFDRSTASDAGSAPADLLQALGEVPASDSADQQNAGEPAADLLGALSNGQAHSIDSGSDAGLAPMF